MSSNAISDENRESMNEILDVVQTYFDGNFSGLSANIEKSFHPVGELYGIDAKSKKVSVLTREGFKGILEKAPSGKSRGVARHDAVLAVDFSGPETALVHVRDPVHPLYWQDLLVLLKTKEGWKIVSKTYKTDKSADPPVVHDAGAQDMIAIASLLKTYFDGLYEGDTKKLGAVFHECSYLRSLEADGTVSNLARDDWFKAVEGRPKPSTQGLARADRVLSITQIGPDCAYAKVRCQITPRYFTDFLTMLKDDKGWRIVSKVYRTDTKL